MRAKKAKAIRKAMKLNGINPREAEYQKPTFHDEKFFDGKGMKTYRVVNPICLESWSGRAKYKAQKKSA